MDIVSGIDSPSNNVFKTYTPKDLCPTIKCYLNTGTVDPNQSNLSTTTCAGLKYDSVWKFTWDQPKTTFKK